MYNQDVLKLLQPPSPYDDDRLAVWPDIPSGKVDWVIVGEAPGKTEVEKGHIMVGRSGKLAREILDGCGLSNYHITNASLWRPTTGTTDTPPTAKLLRLERPRLLMEISMLQPKAIIAMGATAWMALFPQSDRHRGLVKEITIHGRTYPVYLTWHPAYITYNPDVYVDVVTDATRCKNGIRPKPAVKQSPLPGVPPLDAPILGIDTETTNAHFPTADLLCATLSDGDSYWAYESDRLDELGRFLSQYKGRLVGHNGIGDEIILRRYDVEVRLTDDTILHHLAHVEHKGSHKLKVLAPTVAGVDTGEQWVWPYLRADEGDDNERVEWKDIPKEDLVPYCGQDSLVTVRLEKKLESLDDDRTRRVYSFLRRGFRAFADSAAQGVLVDTGRLTIQTAEQKEIINRLVTTFDFNPESQPQTLAALNAAGYRVKSTGAEVLDELVGDLPDRLREYREAEKLYSGFLEPLPRWLSPDGRVRPSYKLFGTDSGRTSCADPNLQQVPAVLKHLFVAGPGKLFVGWDFNVHEVRCLAYYSRDQALCEELRREFSDIHQFVADKIGTDRAIGKRTVFAVAYGVGEDRLAKQTGLSKIAARRAIELVRNLFPALDAWKETVKKEIWEKGYLETPYGRRRHFYYMDEKTAWKAERVGINFLSQSLGGDVAMDSAINVYEALGAAPLIFVHDFNLIEVDEDKVEEVAGQCEEIAGAIMPNEWVRFIPEVKVGKTWGSLK